MEFGLLADLAVAAALGFLVGLQREWATREIAGIRTFPLITILGVLSAVLASRFGGWTFAAGLIGLAALVVVGDVARLRTEEEPDPGITTEVTALLMFAVGGALAVGYTTEAVVVGGAVAVLLHWKAPLHAFTERIADAELQAVIRLTLLGLVILPVLPDRTFGPYAVLNPFRIWLMVVLIVGITLAGYLAARLLGERSGAVAAGVLGGVISSTATSVSYARRSGAEPGRSSAAAVVVMLASTVVFARVLLEVAVVAPDILGVVGPPLALMMLAMAIISAGLYLHARGELATEPRQREPPSQLGTAVGFGLLYAAVLFAVAATRSNFGEGALFGIAALSGLTDVDAITLSIAELVRTGELAAARGWRLILVGALANLAFKGGVISVLGSRALRRRILVVFGLSALAGGLLLAFWPGG